MDKLRVFHSNQTSMCLDPHLSVRLTPWNRFKPSSKIFYRPFQGDTFFVDHLCYLCRVFVMLLRLFIATL